MKQLLALTFFLSLLSCEHKTLSSSKKSLKKKFCTTDSDCTLVTKDCCDCSHGGERISQLKHAKISKKNCSHVMCMAVISSHLSCQKKAQASCKAGECQIKVKD